MKLKRVMSLISKSDPSLKITKKSVTLSAAAVKLLGLTNGDNIQFLYGEDATNERIYVGRSVAPVIKGHIVQNRYIVRSQPLAKWLCEHLEGEGYYRIEEQDSEHSYNGDLFLVFWKKIQ